MKIEIEDSLSKIYGFDFDRNIEAIIKKVPQDHVRHLYKIQVVSSSPERKNKTAFGFYCGEREGEKQPKIIICIQNLFAAFPKLFFKIPILPQMYLARTIYHEIGHHYQRLHYGIEKAQWEKDAKKYSIKMMNKNYGFYIFIFRVLFFPAILIRRAQRNN